MGERTTTLELTKTELQILMAALGNTTLKELRVNLTEDFGAEVAEVVVPEDGMSFLRAMMGEDKSRNLHRKLEETLEEAF